MDIHFKTIEQDSGRSSYRYSEELIAPQLELYAKMILINPDPHDDIKQRFPSHEEDVIIIDKCFGKHDEQNIINQMIEEELKNYLIGRFIR